MEKAAPIARPKLTFPSDVASYVISQYKQYNSILEYGSGGSTAIASELEDKLILSIESSEEWANSLSEYFRISPLTKSVPLIRHVDIGPTRQWGHPDDPSNWRRFKDYPLSPWICNKPFEPDLVLIDGRFRAACFAATTLCIGKPTRVLFDDYTERGYSSLVELIASPCHTVGRMAVFDLHPHSIPNATLARLIPAFFDQS